MSEENTTPASTEAAPEPSLTGQQIGEAIVAIQKCLTAVAKRLEAVEKYVSELPTPAKTYYKPEGYDDYSRAYIPHMDETGLHLALNVVCEKK